MKILKTNILIIVFLIVFPLNGFCLFGFGDIVFDPSNFAKNMISALQNIEQAKKLIEQLQIMYTNLEKFETMLKNPHLSDIEKAEGIFSQMMGLSSNIDNISSEFDELYKDYGDDIINNISLAIQQNKQVQQSRESALRAIESQSIAMSQLPEDREELARLLESSKHASGNLSAQQVQNDILGMVAKQLIRSQLVLIGKYRSESVHMAEEMHRKNAQKKSYQKFVQDKYDEDMKSSIKPRCLNF